MDSFNCHSFCLQIISSLFGKVFEIKGFPVNFNRFRPLKITKNRIESYGMKQRSFNIFLFDKRLIIYGLNRKFYVFNFKHF